MEELDVVEEHRLEKQELMAERCEHFVRGAVAVVF